MKIRLLITALLILFFVSTTEAQAEVSLPQIDQTISAPLSRPTTVTNGGMRYISGIGIGDVYTIFYENRSEACTGGYRIMMNKTTSGPSGFNATSTPTDICDSHFLAKPWPFTDGSNSYSYRAWGAGNYSGIHNLYGSNNMVNWALITTFDINNDQDSQVLYGFHDIVEINGEYIGFAETAGGFTVIVESPDGLSTWDDVAKVGGSNVGDLPLNLSCDQGPVPSGNFQLMEVNGEKVYGKPMIPCDRRAAYLAINAAAAQAPTSAEAEAAFIDPDNWTWSDGSTGAPAPANSLLNDSTSTGGHDIHEVWLLPMPDYRMDSVILYDAYYASGSRGIGCAASNSECLVYPNHYYFLIIAKEPTL